MADLRIVDAPVLLQESITDDVKMPTGGLGNFSVRLGDILWYVITKEQLANKNYVDLSSKGVKDSLDAHIADKVNPHEVTKAQVGLGNVDNTADVDKPVSNAVSSAIITATTDMATKAYVNQKDNLKADKATTLSGYGITDAYTKDETRSRIEINSALTLKADVAYVDGKDGDLTTLTTNDKTNLVKAVNEIHDVTKGVVGLYAQNVTNGGSENGWTDLLVTTHDGTTQREVNTKTLKLAKSISDINAQIATNEKRTVYLDASLNTAIDLKDIDLIGSGYDNVITVAENSFGIQSSVTHPNWDRRRLENLKIVGASRNNTIGFKFADDILAGRRHLNYVSFSNLDVAIKKPKGNIGNTYQNLNISQCNYGYVAVAEAGLKMHTGCDTFRDCQFDNISKWAIDIDDAYAGAGQLAIYDSIFEYCTSGIRINLHNNLTFSPPIIKNCWFEGVANSSEIAYGTFKTIDTRHGSETARMIKLIDVPQIIIDGCFLANMELINSNVYAQNCRIDNSAFSGYPQFFIDANSRLYADNLTAFGTVHKDIIVRSVTARQKKTDTANSFSFRGEVPKGVLNQPLTSVNYIGRTYNGTAGTTVGIKERTYGDNALTGNIINGGCLNKTCLQLPLTVGNIAMLPTVNLTADKWAVWGVTLKASAIGQFLFMDGQGGTSVLGEAIVDVGKWTHTWGVAQVGVSAPVQLRLALSANGTVYIENYFIAEFDTEKEAIDFANARMAILDI